ncbi:hypothetical protein D3C81_2216870 [compost metagenome]
MIHRSRGTSQQWRVDVQITASVLITLASDVITLTMVDAQRALAVRGNTLACIQVDGTEA